MKDVPPHKKKVKIQRGAERERVEECRKEILIRPSGLPFLGLTFRGSLLRRRRAFLTLSIFGVRLHLDAFSHFSPRHLRDTRHE